MRGEEIGSDHQGVYRLCDDDNDLLHYFMGFLWRMYVIVVWLEVENKLYKNTNRIWKLRMAIYTSYKSS